MPPLIENLEQDTVRIDVEFYTSEEMRKLRSFPSWDGIHDVVEDPIEIPSSELLTYYLFNTKRALPDRYGNYDEISSDIGSLLGPLEQYVDFNGSSVSVPSQVANMPDHVTEHLGEAIGLSVINRIHGLTEADWSPIEPRGGPDAVSTLDYQFASDGRNLIQVENKGTVIEDNRDKSDSVYQHKSRISDKKGEIRRLDRRDAYPHEVGICYGTIAAPDRRSQSVAKCWLADPDPQVPEGPPAEWRLLKRLYFISEWVSFLSPRSQIASALRTRVHALRAIENPFELDGVPLREARGDPFGYVSDPFRGQGRTFMDYKSQVVDEPSGGHVVQLDSTRLLLVGIREDLIEMAETQDFSEIEEYKFAARSQEDMVLCLVSERRFQDMDLPENITDIAEQRGGYYRFYLPGRIYRSPGGLVFGTLPLDQGAIAPDAR